MSDEKMMPCPFCGANSGFAMIDTRGWQASCTECHCGTPIGFQTKALAIAAWNRRAAHPPQARDEVQRLAEVHVGSAGAAARAAKPKLFRPTMTEQFPDSPSGIPELMDKLHATEDELRILKADYADCNSERIRWKALAALPPVDPAGDVDDAMTRAWTAANRDETDDAWNTVFRRTLQAAGYTVVAALPLRAAAVSEGVVAERGAERDSLNKVRQEGWREGSEFEREACAKVADNFYPHGPQLGQTIAGYIATAIRARSAAPARGPQEG